MQDRIRWPSLWTTLHRGVHGSSCGVSCEFISQTSQRRDGIEGKIRFYTEVGHRSRPAIPDDSGPNVFEALQGQLGLKLEPQKVIADISVIDHIDKTPTDD